MQTNREVLDAWEQSQEIVALDGAAANARFKEVLQDSPYFVVRKAFVSNGGIVESFAAGGYSSQLSWGLGAVDVLRPNAIDVLAIDPVAPSLLGTLGSGNADAILQALASLYPAQPFVGGQRRVTLSASHAYDSRADVAWVQS